MYLGRTTRRFIRAMLILLFSALVAQLVIQLAPPSRPGLALVLYTGLIAWIVRIIVRRHPHVWKWIDGGR